MQCHLNFSDRPEAFTTGNHKVMFALSFLRGIAQSWFEPGLANLADYTPDWYNNWEKFVGELKINFGPYDAIGDAEAAISRLRMKDSARITNYIVEFNTLAVTLQWGDAALRHRFYEGLPARLKDEICRGDGKPNTLAGMRTKAQQCDARYWERRTEIAREAPSDRPKINPDHRQSFSSRPQHRPQPTKKFFPKPFEQRHPQASSSSSSTGQSHQSRRPTGHSGSSKSKSSDLTGKLTKEGKLTESEKQRRRDNNLCLWCGAAGHMANACPLHTKARAATVPGPPEPPKPAPEPGKE
jgi:hypothetical protein